MLYPAPIRGMTNGAAKPITGYHAPRDALLRFRAMTMTKGKSEATAIYKALVAVEKGGTTVQALVTEAVKSDRPALIATATYIDHKHGKDAKRKRNLLSALRMRIRRACKVLNVDPFTVKQNAEKVYSAEALTVTEKTAETKASEALDRALRVVVENIDNPKVVTTITAAMQASLTGNNVPKAAPAPQIAAH